MAQTVNAPTQHTCGNSVSSKSLGDFTGRVIVRNRSGTQAANINIGYDLQKDEPQQDGDNAIRLMPGDSIELPFPATNAPKVNYINAATGEAPVIEISEMSE